MSSSPASVTGAYARPQSTRRLPAAAVHVLFALLLSALLVPAADARIRVEISGIDGPLASNARAHLDLVRFAEREDLSEAAVRRLYQRAPGQLQRALKPYGHYDAEVVSRSLERDNNGWIARFEVDAGPPVIITDTDIRVTGDGADHPAFRNLVANTTVQPGTQLRHPDFDQLRARLDRAAQTHGFFDRSFETRRLEVDPAERTARAVMVFNTGPRYRFGEINVEQDILVDDLIDRLVFVREGDPFDNERVLRTQYALTDSEYFGNVLVEPGERDPETLTVPVRVETTEGRRQRLRTGIGYGTDTQVRATARWDFRRINRRGHRANITTQVSEPILELSSQYIIPFGDPLRERLAFRSSLISEDLGDTRSQRATLGVNHRRVLGDWQRNLFTDVVDERTRVRGDPAFSDTLIVPGIGFEKLITDDPISPTTGYRLRSELRGSHGTLGSSTDFLRLHLGAGRIMTLGDNTRAVLRSEAGFGLIGGFGELPASQRFFAGGDQSVRGYGFNQLSPRDDEGRVVGGRHLLFASAEIQQRIRGPFQLAGFVDAGNALNNLSDDVQVSVGTGLHIETPIGRIRIEGARAVTESRSFRLHVSIRPDL